MSIKSSLSQCRDAASAYGRIQLKTSQLVAKAKEINQTLQHADDEGGRSSQADLPWHL